MVGGRNFSVFGRPFLDPSAVSVRATVVEKSTKSPEVFYFHNNHQQTKKLHCTFFIFHYNSYFRAYTRNDSTKNK